MSDMSGTKATAIEGWARARGQAALRFDYRGHGQSGGRFADATVGDWLADALAAIDQASQGPQILVGSSMGGWMALLAALARPERVRALVLLAPAPDFTEDLIWARLDDDHRQRLARDGFFLQPSAYGGSYTITRRLIEEGRAHLLLRGPITITAPVRIIHGQADPDVPWRLSLKLAECLVGGDVRLTLIKDGDHRLSRPQDLALLTRTIEGLL